MLLLLPPFAFAFGVEDAVDAADVGGGGAASAGGGPAPVFPPDCNDARLAEGPAICRRAASSICTPNVAFCIMRSIASGVSAAAAFCAPPIDDEREWYELPPNVVFCASVLSKMARYESTSFNTQKRVKRMRTLECHTTQLFRGLTLRKSSPLAGGLYTGVGAPDGIGGDKTLDDIGGGAAGGIVFVLAGVIETPSILD